MGEVATKIVIAAVLVALLSFVQCVINTKRKNRSKQTLLPFLALLYYMIAVGLLLKYSVQINHYLDGLIHSSINLVKIIDVMTCAAVILNIGIFLAYLIVKLTGTGISAIVFRTIRFPRITNLFYEYDTDYNDWFLKEKWVKLVSLFRYLSVAGCLLCGVVLGVLWHMGAGATLYAYIFPVFVQIELVEIFCFLNGYTKREYEHRIVGDNSQSQKISNFYKLREIYEKIFARELLASSTASEYTSFQGITDLLEEMKRSEHPYERAAADFFRLRESNEVYDADCIQAALKLIRGENVIFFNPFYRDLGKYLVLCFLNTLLSGKKCLIFVGRSSAQEDIKQWIAALLNEHAKIRSLWRVRDLSFKEPECEIGVLNFSQLYDVHVMEANREFLQEVGLVFISEPSLIVNTGQVGVSILAQQMSYGEEKPVYCISDRMVDGLVDTMSHLLQTEITEVVAPPVSRSIYTSMAWNADGDFLRQKLFGKQTQDLGNGMELAAVAVKNQIPEVTWYSETKLPIRDLKWMVGQYYPVLCKYMNLPVHQQSLYDKVKFVSNLWGSTQKGEQFLIVEDEFMNIYSTIRTFLSRGRRQTFVNVMSENYLLRDYMRFNPQVFATNPNAIPSLVPDYAKTERNTLIKLLLTMTFRPVTEEEILREYQLVGIETTDASHALSSSLRTYTYATDDVFNIRTVSSDFNGATIISEAVYEIIPEKFEDFFGETLKNAYYICEEERNEQDYLDAKLIGHVTQTILPGQNVTYNGKYYQVKYISAQNGVILRRASNLFHGRKYYRQIRHYIFENTEHKVISSKMVMDIEFTRFMADFSVRTTGYFELNDNNDLRSARLVDFSKDPDVDAYIRNYHNKSVLKLKMPNGDGNLRFTLCMLLSETLKTVFPNAWQYLAVTAVMPESAGDSLHDMIYKISGNVDPDDIYLVEDSEIDLGLLDAIEKNMLPLLEIVSDFLDWHFEQMQEEEEFAEETQEETTESLGEAQEETTETAEEAQEKEAKPAEETESVEEEEVREEEQPAEETAESLEEAQEEEEKPAEETESAEEEEAQEEEQPAEETQEETAESLEETQEEEESAETSFAQTKSYQETCYLKFGFEHIDGRIKLEAAQRYLALRGLNNNSLTKARKGEALNEEYIEFDAVNHCDFCGLPLNGVSYEKLTDGRIRCNDCTVTAITSVEEFRELFYQTVQMMENFFGIEYKAPVAVRTVDAKKIAKGIGSVYYPTTGFAARTLGYAQYKNGAYSMNIENGSPRLATIETMVHEMTHVWQYINWRKMEFKTAYTDREKRDILYEGMAMWVSIQYLYLLGEKSYARREEEITKQRTDVYGIGFREYVNVYPLSRDSSILKNTPFKVFPPLDI